MARETHQSEQMKAPVLLLGPCAGIEDCLFLVEVALFDADVDLDDILPYDASSSNVEVPNLRVAH